MPTPSEIARTAVVIVQRDILPPIIKPIEEKVKDLEEKIRQLEEKIKKLENMN